MEKAALIPSTKAKIRDKRFAVRRDSGFAGGAGRISTQNAILHRKTFISTFDKEALATLSTPEGIAAGGYAIPVMPDKIWR